MKEIDIIKGFVPIQMTRFEVMEDEILKAYAIRKYDLDWNELSDASRSYYMSMAWYDLYD